MIIKLAALGALLGIATSVIGDWAAQVAILAAGLAGAGYIYKNVLRPFTQLLRRALLAWEIWEGMPDWMRGVDLRLSSLEHHVGATHEPVSAIARELGVTHRPPPPPPDPLA